MGNILDNKRNIDSMVAHDQDSEAALAALGRRVLEIMGIYMCREYDATYRSACCAKTHIVKRSLNIEDRDLLTRNIFDNYPPSLPVLICTRNEQWQRRWRLDPRNNRTARFTIAAPAISYFCPICSTYYSEEQVRLLPDEPDDGWDDDQYEEESEAEEDEEYEAEEDEEDEEEVLNPLEETEE